MALSIDSDSTSRLTQSCLQANIHLSSQLIALK